MGYLPDLEDLKQYAKSVGAPEADDLKQWDVAFWSERLREEKYSITEVSNWTPLSSMPSVSDQAHLCTTGRAKAILFLPPCA